MLRPYRERGPVGDLPEGGDKPRPYWTTKCTWNWSEGVPQGG